MTNIKLNIAMCIIVSVIIFGSLKCTSDTVAGGTETGDAIGILYNPNGTRAANAKVYIISVNHNPKPIQKIRSIDSTITDDTGAFTIDSMPEGYYNILGSGDSGVCYNDSVFIIGDTTTENLSDTLRDAGKLRGVVRLQPGDDSRTVFILVFGTQTWTTPADSIGNFTLSNMSKGTYHVRLLTTLDDYDPLDTNLTIFSGADTTLEDTIYLPFTGIPIPQGLTLAYDTMKQIVTLTWNACDTTLVKGYNVYRKHSDSDFVKINIALITDTTYSDSSAIQDQTYEYKLKALDSNGNEGLFSTGIQVYTQTNIEILDSIKISFGTGNSYLTHLGDSLFVDRTKDLITILDSSFNIFSSFSLPDNFGNGEGHEIDNQGRVWAANYSNGHVNIYLQDGTLVDSIRDSNISHPNVLKRGPEGHMFIKSEVEPYIEVIRVYNLQGEFISLFPNDSLPIRTSITDMLFNKNSNLIILNHKDSIVSVFDSSGVEIIQSRLNSMVMQIVQFINGNYAIIQDGNRGVLNILDNQFKLLSIYGTGFETGYQDFGRMTIDSKDRLILRRINLILIYKIR